MFYYVLSPKSQPKRYILFFNPVNQMHKNIMILPLNLLRACITDESFDLAQIQIFIPGIHHEFINKTNKKIMYATLKSTHITRHS